MTSAVCEAFGCLPSAARRELQRDPDRTALRILELRAYAKAKAAIDASTSVKDAPTGAMVDLVRQVQADILREARAADGK